MRVARYGTVRASGYSSLRIVPSPLPNHSPSIQVMRSRDAERMGRFGRSYRTGLAGNADGRDFRQLWVGDTISQFSTQVGVIALPPAPSDRVLVRLFGAPLVILVDAVSCLGAVVFILRIRNREEPSPKEGRRRLTVEIGAGCRSSNVAQVSFRQRLGPAPAARPEERLGPFHRLGIDPGGGLPRRPHRPGPTALSPRCGRCRRASGGGAAGCARSGGCATCREPSTGTLASSDHAAAHSWK